LTISLTFESEEITLERKTWKFLQCNLNTTDLSEISIPDDTIDYFRFFIRLDLSDSMGTVDILYSFNSISFRSNVYLALPSNPETCKTAIQDILKDLLISDFLKKVDLLR
jgi:hypothetical protein